MADKKSTPAEAPEAKSVLYICTAFERTDVVMNLRQLATIAQVQNPECCERLDLTGQRG